MERVVVEEGADKQDQNDAPTLPVFDHKHGQRGSRSGGKSREKSLCTKRGATPWKIERSGKNGPRRGSSRAGS